MLRNIGKKIAVRALLISGVVKLRRIFFQKKKVTILLLHDPTPESFSSLLQALQQRYNFVALEEFIRLKREGKLYRLPDYAAIMTLDDGHKNNYRLLGAIKKHSVPVTIFICSEIVTTHRHFWSNYSIPKMQLEALKTLPNSEMLAQLRIFGYEKLKEYPERHGLSAQELSEMAASGLVDFQSHTCFHPILTQVGDAESKYEIEQSKKSLEQSLQKSITGFAYPNGDYGSREVGYVERAGYKYAVTVDEGFNDENTNIFTLQRICLNDAGSVAENIIKACGLWRFLK